MSDFLLRLRETGALVLRAPREAVFAAARVPVDFERLFPAVPEAPFDREDEAVARPELDRLDAVVERLEALFVERPEAAFVPPRALLRAAVLPELDFAEPERVDRDFAEADLSAVALRAPDLRAVEPRLDPDATADAKARMVRFTALFMPCEFVAPLLLAVDRFAPDVERELAAFPVLRLAPLRELDEFAEALREPDDFADVLREPEDFAAALRVLVPDLAEVRRGLEAALFRAVVLLVPPEALLRAVAPDVLLRAVVEDLRAALVLRPDVPPSADALLRSLVDDLRAAVFLAPLALFDAVVRLREPDALRRVVPLRVLAPSLFAERRFAVDPLFAPAALRPPPRERTNLKKRLVAPEPTWS